MNQQVYDPVKPVVETKYGKIRGITYGDIQMYMGVKYADAARFKMPVDQQPWEGVKNALKYGHISPQMGEPEPPNYYRGLFLHQKEGEDCQNLNIWAPKHKEGEKKPVFVWMHGGGFMAGNAMEEYSFDGYNLAHDGDVVFVSVNHRLNILGYMNLTEYGEEFANTPNLGIADLVAALKWIHENIEAFGGNPENVTICGHSGGGGKVLCMYQLEEAAPYFQKGICLSGTTPEPPASEADDAKLLAKSILDRVGITKENIEDIYTIPYVKLLSAYKNVGKKLWDEGHFVVFEPLKNEYFPGFPPFEEFHPSSCKKPLLITTTLAEFGRCSIPVEDRRTMSVDEKEDYLRKQYGENADKLMELFRKTYPTHDILDLAYVDNVFRAPAVAAAKKKASCKSNNTYVFLSAYNMAEDEGIPMWHGGEVCYAFKSTDRVYVANEAIDGPKKIEIFSSIMMNMCKNGTPGNEYLPEWKPFTEENPVTMVIDKVSEAKCDSDTELLALIMESTEPFRLRAMYADDTANLQLGID